MKLISCYIENFGKYENARFDFDRGLTSYLMDNGEGKTTLATFLRVMLYGMGTDRGDAYGIRSRYYPFQGGNYGGWLQIEWQGKVYKIIRSFDKKSAPKDILIVRDEHEKECTELGMVPGLTVFGLNEEAFLRTSYLTCEKMDIDLQNGIGERLCGLVSDASTVPLDKALSALSDYEKNYHSGRRKGGVFTGYIPETEEKIASLQAEIYAVEGLEKQLLAAREEYRLQYDKEQKLLAEIEKMQAAGTYLSRWEHYQSLCVSAAEEGKKRQALETKYPSGFPTEEEVKQLKENLRSARDLQTRLQHRRFAGQDELLKKEAQFKNGVPTRERMERMEDLVDEYLSQSSQAAYAPAPVQNAPAKKRGGLLLWVLLGLVLLVGGVCLLPMFTGLAAVVIGLGAAALVAGLVSRKKDTNPSLPVYVPQVASVQNTELKARLEDFFWEYDVRISDFTAALRILKEDVRALHALRAERETYEAETVALQQQEQGFSQEAQRILGRYALNEEGWENALRDGFAYAEATRMESQKQQQAAEYRLRYGLQEAPTTDSVNSEALKQEYRSLQETVRELRVKQQSLETELARLPSLRLELSEQQERLSKYIEEKEMISVAVSSLQTADSNLKDTYLLPMQKSFLNFAGQMGAEWADSVTIGDELQLFFEARGQLRREEHFSDGQRALAVLAMRLALMENIYKGEMPFCILDDPFVHLDERHLEEVRVGIRALSEKMQIVYFTCHASRII